MTTSMPSISAANGQVPGARVTSATAPTSDIKPKTMNMERIPSTRSGPLRSSNARCAVTTSSLTGTWTCATVSVYVRAKPLDATGYETSPSTNPTSTFCGASDGITNDPRMRKPVLGSLQVDPAGQVISMSEGQDLCPSNVTNTFWLNVP